MLSSKIPFERTFLIKIGQVMLLTCEFLHKGILQAKIKRIVRDLIIFIFCQSPVYLGIITCFILRRVEYCDMMLTKISGDKSARKRRHLRLLPR